MEDYTTFNSCLDTIFTVNKFPIYYKNTLLGEFKLLSENELNEVKQEVYGNFSNLANITLDSFNYKTIFIKKSLLWWIFSETINNELIENLKQEYFTIFDKEIDYINTLSNNLQPYKNNIKALVDLHEKNSKNSTTILNNVALSSKIFCKDCSRNETCTMKDKLGKILPISSYMLNFAYNHLNKKYEYMVPGTWADQPKYFNELLNYTINQIFIAQQEKNKQEKGN